MDKKLRTIGIIFYSVLIGGFTIIMGLFAIGYFFFRDEVQLFFDKLGIFAIAIIYGIFGLYFYAVKRVVCTDLFEKYEKAAIKKHKENKQIYKKRWIIILSFITPVEVLHFFLFVYALFLHRTRGNLTSFMEFMASQYSLGIIIVYALFVFYYIYTYCRAEGKQHLKKDKNTFFDLIFRHSDDNE